LTRNLPQQHRVSSVHGFSAVRHGALQCRRLHRYILGEEARQDDIALRVAFAEAARCQGFARERQVAVSPIAFAPMKTLFHELAHVLLGHTSESQQSDDEQTPRNIAEVEAESIALLCLESLGLPGGDHCRGYVQHWLAGDDIPERSAQKIFKAADQILKAGAPAVCAPVYSHLHYDIVSGGLARVEQPDILILEGLNVLQSPGDGSRMFVSDFFDFSIYMDADDQTIEVWYIERFLRLRETVFRNKDSYFHRYSQLSESEAVQTARRIWEEINLPNLRDNIGPTKERAQLILEKGADHRVENILLRRL